MPAIEITTLRDGSEEKRSCSLPPEGKPPFIVGRSRDTDLALEDEHISRHHLRFFHQDGLPYVEDLGSRWGTQLNGNPLTQPTPLTPGDVLILGKTRIRFCLEVEAAVPHVLPARRRRWSMLPAVICVVAALATFAYLARDAMQWLHRPAATTQPTNRR